MAGQEWALLKHCRSLTAAWQVLRFLCNGIPGGARWRAAADRTDRLCTCGAAAVYCWSSSARASDGTIVDAQGWCEPCMGRWSNGQRWALLQEEQIPLCLREKRSALLRERGPGPAALGADTH
eukprot:6866477-Pyramimonas_sp.AAC.1